ncbi:MAG: ABC transporter substrate-binding protein [Chloroflexota bacterium]
MIGKQQLGGLLTGFALLMAACSPPLAATPTAAPTVPAKPTTAAAPAGGETAKPAATTAAAAPVPKTAASPADEEIAKIRAQYFEAAKSEGKLVIYGVGPPELFNPVKAAFEQDFPGISLEGVDQRGRETREKILAEQQSRNFVVDVAISGPDTQASLIEAKVTEDFGSQFVDKVVPDLRPQYASSNPRTVNIYSMAVNTNLVPAGQEPKNWNDALDPSWQGKLAMDDPRGSGPGGTILSGVEQVLGQEWSAKLAPQKVFFATQSGPLWAGMVRGEYAIFLSAQHTDVIVQKKSGAPIKQVRPVEGIGLTPIAQSLIKGAPHPNAGKLWIDWSLSEKGQQVLGDLGYGPVRQGITPKIDEANLGSTKILPRDDDVAGFQSLEERTKRWSQLFFN